MISINDIYETRAKFYMYPPNGKPIAIKQDVFFREFYPSGHLINDPAYYENILKKAKKESDGKKEEIIVEQPIERVCIPLQQVIESKHTTHCCGNNVKFIDADISESENSARLLAMFRQGWIRNNMEVMKYKFVETLNRTGEAAACISIDDGKIRWNVFNPMKGDVLHPVYNDREELEVFGRSYFVYDYQTKTDIEYMEVWDDTYLTRYRRADGSDPAEIQTEDGWIQVSRKSHNCYRIPVIYVHNPEGACWSSVQPLIDKMEMALSQLFENNKSYAFRIMLIKGGFEVQGDLRGQARAILLDSDSDAKFLEKADVSNSFLVQIEQTMKFIEYGGFIVFPPELKSGDTPSVAIKVMYAPAIEKAMKDINNLNPYIDNMVDIFKHYFGIQNKMSIDFANADIYGELIPYIPTNVTETINNINQSVANGSLSRKTAAENNEYAHNNEYGRILQERREELIGVNTNIENTNL